MENKKTLNPYHDAVDEICDWINKYKVLLEPYQMISILFQYGSHITFFTTNGNDEETQKLIQYCIDEGKKSAQFTKENGEGFLFFEQE